MKKIFWQISIFAVLAFMPNLALAGTTVNIDADGNAKVEGLKVMQIAGTTLFTRLTWGDAYVRMTVKAGDKTPIFRGTGEKTTVSEIAVGDIINTEGTFESGGSAMSLIPKKITDISIQKNQATMSGTVTSVNISNNKITFLTKKNEPVTMIASTSVTVKKGSRVIAYTSIVSGDKLTEVVGEYDRATKTIVASKVNVYIDKNLYVSKQHKGKLVSLPTPENMAQINVKISGNVYQIQIAGDTKILNSAGKTTTMNRFDVDDSLTITGKRIESDELIISASSIKNNSI